MTNHSSLSDYDTQGLAIQALSLPELSAGDTFYLSSTDYIQQKDMAKAAEEMGLQEEDFLSPEEYRDAMRQTRFWEYEVFVAAKGGKESEKVAASTLQALLGKYGQNWEKQSLAIASFEENFVHMTLGFNDFLQAGYTSIEDLLSDKFQRKKPPLFSNSAEDQADLAQAKETGLWTVIDQSQDKTIISASSTLQGALKKAWDLAPCLDPLRRQKTLQQQLPSAQERPASKPRF